MKDVLSVSKKPAPQSHRSPKRPEKSAPKNARPSLPASAFLPTTRAEADARGWGQLDFVYVSGDAYVDHPSFGSAIITRVLESHGYKVGFIAQPRLERPGKRRGVRRAAVGIPRVGGQHGLHGEPLHGEQEGRRDAATPGGGARAARAPTARPWSIPNLIRRTFKETPIIFGHRGASLLRSPVRLLVDSSSAPSCSIPGPISSPTAWGSALSSRLPMPLPRAFP